ncbi:MAG: AAA family ATPase [Gemmatimonadaceae bacterium]
MSSFESSALKPQSPIARRERRNWLVRSVFAKTQRRGPVRYWSIATVLALGALAALGMWRTSRPALIVATVVPYSALAEALAQHKVSELVIDDHGARLQAVLNVPYKDGDREVTTVQTVIPSIVTLSDLERWSSSGAKVRVLDAFPGRSSEMLIQVITLLAVVGAVLFVIFRQRGGLGASKFVPTPPSRRLTLADVGGAREAQAELRDVIAYLKKPERFRAMGAKCPKGVLLIGPPGTGKTLLARAVAGEAGVPVIIAAGSDFNEMYVGVGSRRVRQLAKQARETAPCIVFIDEFDSLGGRRGRPNRSGEEEVTLNQLLVEMDGMNGNEGVVWMAATNREDMLDPAVRRPGRFDRVVEVPLPTVGDRLEILRIHAASAPLAPDVDLDRLSQLTVGHSGADLANLLNEAAITAVQDDCDVITKAHIETARDKILLGRVRAGVVVSESERRLIALHEAGHAVVGMVAAPDDKLHKITIEARGRSLGAAHFAPEADRHLQPRHYLEGIIAKALGGRAAETVFFGSAAVTTGAGSDLISATGIARRMVAEFGMSDEVGLVSADLAAQGGSVSSQLQSAIDTAMRKLLTAQSERAESIVREYRDLVEELATELLAREVLDSEHVYALADKHGVAPRIPVLQS